MAFFGMYPSKYIGGNPYGLCGLNNFSTSSFFMGAHPNSINSGNVNYFSGNAQGVNAAQGTTQIQNNQNAAQNNNNKQAPVQDTYQPQTMSAQVQNLQNILNSAKNEQGIIGKTWDGIKSFTGLGLSEKKCQTYIANVQNGNMSYDEAFSKISKYSSKQKSGVNLITGITTGVATAAALGFAPLTGGASILAAAGIGAATKAGLKTADRATNNIQNDALNLKQIAKDGLSGALDGAVSTATIGIGKEAVLSAKTAKEAMKQGIIAGAKGGAISGAAMGAGDYSIDCAFGDQKFEADNLILNTTYGAVAGAATGAIIGGIQGKKSFKPEEPNPPKVDAPDTNPPKGDAPDIEAKTGETKTGDAPDVEAPKADTPDVETQTGDIQPEKAPEIEAQGTDAPEIEAQTVDTTDSRPITDKQAETTGEAPKADTKTAEGKTNETKTGDTPDVEAPKADTPDLETQTSDIQPEKAPEIEAQTTDTPEIEAQTVDTTDSRPITDKQAETQTAETQTVPTENEPDQLIDNLNNFLSGKKGATAAEDEIAENLRNNSTGMITSKKLSGWAKFKGFFGFNN